MREEQEVDDLWEEEKSHKKNNSRKARELNSKQRGKQNLNCQIISLLFPLQHIENCVREDWKEVF